jgi:lipoprotein-releasing system permease protein
MKIFVLEGLIIGVIGTIMGVASGLLIALNLEPIINVIEKATGLNFFSQDVYYLDHFPSLVVPSDVVLISVTAVLISFIATLYPSWQASRMLPAEALRYE